MNTETVSHAASETSSSMTAEQAFAAGPHFHPFTPSANNWWSVMYTPSWTLTQSTWDVWQRVALMPWNLVWSAWQMADSHTAQALRRYGAPDRD